MIDFNGTWQLEQNVHINLLDITDFSLSFKVDKVEGSPGHYFTVAIKATGNGNNKCDNAVLATWNNVANALYDSELHIIYGAFTGEFDDSFFMIKFSSCGQDITVTIFSTNADPIILGAGLGPGSTIGQRG